jgi:hypothetical protein
MPVKIFFCYAHEDEFLLKQLKRHLKPLQRQGLIDMWYDRDISAGTEWEQEISKRLKEAQIILLLISPDFMYSDYCYGVEMQKALERHAQKEVTVIPIILRPIYWEGTLGNIQALPTDARPVVDRYWHNLDEAFFDVAEGIRKAAEKLISPLLPGQNVSLKVPILKPTGATETIALNPKTQESANQKTSYQQFFADLLERLKTTRPGITAATKTQQESFWWFGAGKTGFEFTWAFTKEGLKTGLIINIPGNLDATKKAFDALYEQRAAIEKEFGQSIVWERRSEGKESHILLIRLATIVDPVEKLERTKIWAVETMLKFVDVFQKRIKML